jgi:hypothetical protein
VIELPSIELPLAHGLSGRADLPIPEWLFGWAAAAVLMVSFVALAALWHSPKLEGYELRSLPAKLSSFLTSTAVEVVCGAIGVLLFALVVVAGIAGVDSPGDNIAPTFIYVIFWVGLVIASAFFGNVFRPFNPWIAIGRAVGWLTRGGRIEGALPYPDWLGRWPAAAGLIAFTWLELVAPAGATPRTLAAATLVYSAVTFLGMGLFGVETWSRRGEAFSVYFELFGRIGVFERRENEIGVRPPLAGLTQLEPLPGTIAVLATMIGSTTFDGFQETGPWADIGVPIASFFRDLGAGPSIADELAAGIGLLVTIGVVGSFYLLGVAGATTAGGGYRTRGLARAFVHSLVPIAFVYVLAHYLTFLLFQGQAMWYLISDPLGKGWDLFGTVDAALDYGLIGATVTWYVQVAVVVAGHASGLILAHDRALLLYDDPREASRSQLWMLAIMIGFTSLALWLLSQGNA